MPGNTFTLFRTFFMEIKSIFPRNPHGDFAENSAQWVILRYLITHEGQEVTQKEIEQATKRSRATVSGLLDTLEKKGLVIRIPSQSDKRKKNVQVTEAVQSKHQAMMNYFTYTESVVTKDISEQDLQVFYRVMGQMIENVRKEKKHV